MARCPSCSSEAGSGRFCPSCGASLSDSEAPTRLTSSGASSSDPSRHGRFLPGTLVGERYRIVALLGRGGMGEVYRGDDLKLGQAVALKFLPPGIDQDAARLARFHDEVRIARQVAHPNVCRVYDVGEVEGNHFLTMEYVDGEDLASLLRRIGRLPSDKGIEIARQISAGLAAAHDAGVLHRDLKPSNIMIDGRGRARVTDFGLAALGDSVQGDEARSGTPAYMAPEQLQGKAVTQRSDLYALGLILYEIFTGKRPYSSASGAELLRKQTTTSPTSPSSVVGGIDPAVERIILRCLSPDPGSRPASALAVAAALPGGDPIAAALAAGETPSPQLVAAASEHSGIKLSAAAAGLAGVILGMAILVPLARPTQILLLAPLSKPPEVLTEKAREVLRDLGYHDSPADSFSGFEYHRSYIDHLARPNPPASWREALGHARPAPLLFRYRESPRLLDKTALGTIGDWFSDPPPTLPGMAQVTLAPDGTLLALDVTSPERLPSGGGTTGDPDWPAVLRQAGFQEGKLQTAEPEWVPRGYADIRRAWKGEIPGSPPTPVRLEAASLGGRIVSFRALEPWDISPIDPVPEAADPWPLRVTRMGIFFTAMITGAVVATRNMRKGRGDLKGALRCALYLGAVRLLWMLAAHHLASGQEIDLIIGHLAWSAWRVAMVAIFYLALEPYARRIWPRMLVSWVRLLEGRLKDSLVGHDILAGSFLGVLMALIAAGTRLLILGLGQPGSLSDQDVWNLEVLRGLRPAIAALLGRHTTAALDLFFPIMLLLLIRLITGRTWAAMAGVTLLGLVMFYPAQGSVPVFLASTCMFTFLFFVALFRFGLLTLVVSWSVFDVLNVLPVGFNPGSWYAASTLLPLIVIAAVAFWGFRGCAAGRPLFRDPVFEAESARS